MVTKNFFLEKLKKCLTNAQVCGIIISERGKENPNKPEGKLK
jgi:hypothetical protein